ncbi:hypothetical protein [Azospirillum agricola]|uniref:hypothetical protein n=1 Tax=Azospirillum agricola TaxID=1720247 RepID=UPI000A0F2A23|nr:hypothetical protein [Azospirillum agricola]SMH62847.1 hypothetical protein SAMN02982994_6670 [Azospirillum lipoferum]
MAPPPRRSRAAKPAPVATPVATDPVDEDTLVAAARHFGIQRDDILAVAITAERAVVVTVDGRKLVQEA